jgi:hypothetical protein
LNGRELCVGCDRFVNKNNMYKMNYKTIIKNNENETGNEKLQNEDKNKQPTIPYLIRKICGINMLDTMYYKFKKSEDWLKNEVDLCDECYMSNTKL